MKYPSLTLIMAVALLGAGCAQPAQPQQQAQQAPVTTAPPNIPMPTSVTPSSTPTPTARPTTKPAVKKASTVVVEITNTQFSPQVIAAAVGDTVTWVNKDTRSHTSHSDGSQLWDTGAIAPGKSASHKFNAPGTYPYSDGSFGFKGTVIIR